jgi:hypothetical protein
MFDGYDFKPIVTSSVTDLTIYANSPKISKFLGERREEWGVGKPF